MQTAWQTKDVNKGATLRKNYPSRAHQVPLATLHHHLLQPPHSQPHIQLQLPLPQPLRLWQRAQALLARLPLPMVLTQPPLRFLRHLLPVRQWPPALPRVGMRLIIIITLLYPLREPTRLIFMSMQLMSLVILCQHLGMPP